MVPVELEYRMSESEGLQKRGSVRKKGLTSLREQVIWVVKILKRTLESDKSMIEVS